MGVFIKQIMSYVPRLFVTANIGVAHPKIDGISEKYYPSLSDICVGPNQRGDQNSENYGSIGTIHDFDLLYSITNEGINSCIKYVGGKIDQISNIHYLHKIVNRGTIDILRDISKIDEIINSGSLGSIEQVTDLNYILNTGYIEKLTVGNIHNLDNKGRIDELIIPTDCSVVNINTSCVIGKLVVEGHIEKLNVNFVGDKLGKIKELVIDGGRIGCINEPFRVGSI